MYVAMQSNIIKNIISMLMLDLNNHWVYDSSPVYEITIMVLHMYEPRQAARIVGRVTPSTGSCGPTLTNPQVELINPTGASFL